mmetsp:Transcript_17202/g.39638  ORF Transcript_17202/g.39638 Transcript_17202/m.39638 type:complete len:99 (+) Transcript_17202:376-672(+)
MTFVFLSYRLDEGAGLSGSVLIVFGVSTLPFLFGIAIFKRYRDLYGIPPHVTNLVEVFTFRTSTDLPWRCSCTTSLQNLVMFSCACQWLETASQVHMG